MALLRLMHMGLKSARPPLPDFEFVLLTTDGDSPTMNPFSVQVKYPVFHAIRCWPNGGFTLPILHSHFPQNLTTYDSDLEEYARTQTPFESRRPVAVFRGGFVMCFQERDNFDQPFVSSNFSNCGRRLLLKVASAHPELIDFRTDHAISMLQAEPRVPLCRRCRWELSGGLTGSLNSLPRGWSSFTKRHLANSGLSRCCAL